MKKEIPHGEVGHYCHGGCAGYAKGGRVPEQLMDAIARNREEVGLPATEGGVSRLVDLIPGVGLVKKLGEESDIKDRLANPELLHNTAGRALDTNFTHGGPSDKFGKEADVQMFSEGGEVTQEDMTALDKFDPKDEVTQNDMMFLDKKDPSIIPEEIKEYVNQAHKDKQESRPDENWRIKPAEKPGSVVPYKKDEEEDHGEGPSTSGIPHFDEGGEIPEPNALLQDIAPAGTGILAPSPAAQPPNPPPTQVAQVPTPTPPPAAPVVPRGTTPPASTDQDFMDRANKMMGLNPAEQAGFMKLLGQNAQKSQIGAGIAGIGDAIAAGGTLGKVNPGALNRSEDIAQNATKAGIEGMQTIRGNQEKTFDIAQKLEAQDPNSPLSKYAQKAYGDVGKKLGLDLSHASASLIADVAGKGVEELNTEYQGQLKQMGLQLQKEQVEATKANQEAERRQAALTAQQNANKELAGQGLLKKLTNALTPSGRAAQKELTKEAVGTTSYAPDVLAYAQKHQITPEQAQAVKDRRTGGQ